MSDSVTPWTVTLQAPLSMGFSRQEYWSGLPFPSPGHLPGTGSKPESLGIGWWVLYHLVPPGKTFTIYHLPFAFKSLSLLSAVHSYVTTLGC